jgi:hypothetical protein
MRLGRATKDNCKNWSKHVAGGLLVHLGFIQGRAHQPDPAFYEPLRVWEGWCLDNPGNQAHAYFLGGSSQQKSLYKALLHEELAFDGNIKKCNLYFKTMEEKMNEKGTGTVVPDKDKKRKKRAVAEEPGGEEGDESWMRCPKSWEERLVSDDDDEEEEEPLAKRHRKAGKDPVRQPGPPPLRRSAASSSTNNGPLSPVPNGLEPDLRPYLTRDEFQQIIAAQFGPSANKKQTDDIVKVDPLSLPLSLSLSHSLSLPPPSPRAGGRGSRPGRT